AVAADESQCCVPRPDRDGKIEGRDHRDRTCRMPALHHAMAGAFGCDGETIELARQADREVADVDHLLHFAKAFLENLARLQCNEPSELFLVRAQFLAE